MSSTFSRLFDQPFLPQPEHLAALHKSFPYQGWDSWAPGQPIPGGLDSAGAWFLTYVCTRPPKPLTLAEIKDQRRADLRPHEAEISKAAQNRNNNVSELRKASSDRDRQRLTRLVSINEARLAAAKATFEEVFAREWHAWEHHAETLLGLTTHQPDTTTTEQEEEQLPDLLDDHEPADDCDLLDDHALLA